MRGNPKTVKRPKPRERYHHGYLRDAVIKGAEALLEERGLERFSLREVARRVGVSPMAPAHHFGDCRGLLTAVAAAAFERFGVALEEAEKANEEKPLRDRLKAQSLAYLRFALREGPKFNLMWRIDLIDRAAADYTAAVQRATGVLGRARNASAPPFEPNERDRDVETRVAMLKDPAMETGVAVWSLVHGFSTLAIDGVFGVEGDGTGRDPEALLSALVDRLVL